MRYWFQGLYKGYLSSTWASLRLSKCCFKSLYTELSWTRVWWIEGFRIPEFGIVWVALRDLSQNFAWQPQCVVAHQPLRTHGPEALNPETPKPVNSELHTMLSLNSLTLHPT